MTTAEVEALLRLLAEWERDELELLMQERREAEREGRLQKKPDESTYGLFRECRSTDSRNHRADRISTAAWDD